MATLKKVLLAILGITLVYALYSNWVVTLSVIGGLLAFVAGVGLTIWGFALASIFFKETLRHKPDQPERLALFVEVEEKRAVVIDRAGTPISIIHGGDNVDHVASWQELIGEPQVKIGVAWLYDLWERYKRFVYNYTGLYVYLPFFTAPKVIPLPRYRTKGNEKGEKVYVRVTEDDEGFNTNHVRVAPTIWNFRFGGVDIDGLPFTVNGSLLYLIDGDYDKKAMDENMDEAKKEAVKKAMEKECERANRAIYNSLYKTDSWNVLLDESANSVIRATVRDEASIDRVLGKVERNLWKDKTKPSLEEIKELSDEEKAKIIQEELFSVLSMQLLEKLTVDVIGQTKLVEKDDEPQAKGFSRLEDYGIKILQVFITDFIPEVEGEELRSLRAPALGRQEARAIEARGSANVNVQGKLRKVHKDGGSVSEAILNAEALVRALQGASGQSSPSTESALLAKLALKEGSSKGGAE